MSWDFIRCIQAKTDLRFWKIWRQSGCPWKQPWAGCFHLRLTNLLDYLLMKTVSIRIKGGQQEATHEDRMSCRLTTKNQTPENIIDNENIHICIVTMFNIYILWLTYKQALLQPNWSVPLAFGSICWCQSNSSISSVSCVIHCVD